MHGSCLEGLKRKVTWSCLDEKEKKKDSAGMRGEPDLRVIVRGVSIHEIPYEAQSDRNRECLNRIDGGK